MTEINTGASAEAFVERGASAETTMKERGYLTYEVVGPDGKVKQTATSENALTTVGADYILKCFKPINSLAAITPIYLGLIGSLTTLDNADTMAVGGHTGWDEEDANGYARQVWNAETVVISAPPASLAEQSTWAPVSGRGQMVVYGAFLVTDLTLAAGVLIATSALTGAGSITVSEDDTLNITFKLTLA